MDPQTFDGTAGVGLLLLMPTSVLFAAAAIRRLGAPRWAWVAFLSGVVGVLVLLHFAGRVRYDVDVPDPAPFSPWDLWQFVGLGLGRVGVAVNGAVAAAWGILRPRRAAERLPRREGRLVVASSLTMAVAAAVPAAWWATGLGVVPLLVELPVVLAAAGFLAAALTLRMRRLRTARGADGRSGTGGPSGATLWPADAVVAVWLVGALAVGPLFLGSGQPDGALAAEPVGRPSTSPRTPDPEWPGPTPAASTSLGATAVERGTRALLADTVRWAGPLDDLAAPTPASAGPPPVVLVEQACDGDGRRWTGSLVLPTVRPQDVAARVLAGWRDADYAPIDRAMGTDVVGPVRSDAAVARMRLGGGTDGVHVDVESFCTTG